MVVAFEVPLATRPRYRWVSYSILAFVFALSGRAHAQTASTGALIGVTLDPAGSVIPSVILHLVNPASGDSRSATSDKDGRFSFLFLRPGSYELHVSKASFAPLITRGIDISVTEIQRVEIHLRLATVLEQMQVSSERPLVQNDNSALGRVVDEVALTSLPLVTRNLAQIAGLSPGVNAGVFNAGELGLGGIALSQIAKSNDGIFVHGHARMTTIGNSTG